MSKIGLLLISTGKYHYFIQPLISSADKFFLSNHEVVYFLFTDSKEKYVTDREIVYIPIEHSPWPFPTLLRYHHFIKSENFILDMNIDYLFYSDIDMLFVDTVSDDILSDRVVTIHPGFLGNRGTPETRPQSLAYVNSDEYMVYYAGGFNGGTTTCFLDMSKIISKNIDIDHSNGIIAIWHDESHINRYMVDNRPTKVLDPGYCYGESMNIPYHKRLIALNKNHYEIRC